MKPSLSGLTICIFTYERKLDLERLVKYWSSTDVKVIILDASNQPAKILNSKNLKYLHTPNASVQKRLLKFSEIVETKYILLSPDDDFFALEGISKTLKFLDNNSEFSSAQGLRIRFFDFPNFHWIPDYVKQMMLKFVEKDKIERLNKMASSMHYIYSVIRVTDFTKIVKCFNNVNTEKRDASMMGELIFNYTLPVLGKHIVLPVFYSARKAHPYEGGDIVFGNWINDESDADRNIFVSNVIEFYVSEIKCTKSEALSIFSNLTKNFTRVKPVNADKNIMHKRFVRKIVFRSKLCKLYIILKIKYKRFARKIIFRSKLRTLYSISKINFFKLYILLIKNHMFLQFLRDFRVIKHFLDNNRIKYKNL